VIKCLRRGKPARLSRGPVEDTPMLVSNIQRRKAFDFGNRACRGRRLPAHRR